MNNYHELVESIGNLLHQARHAVVQYVNVTLVQTYRNIGKMIVEHEQGGISRAKYGQDSIKQLSRDLTAKFWSGFSWRNLYQMRQCYAEFPKLQTLTAKFKNLGWTHYIRLMSIKNLDERNFYLIETSKNNRSIRELNRQFDSALYERLALSRDKKWVKKLAEKGQIVDDIHDSLKDPYVLEFLGLREENRYSESDLENAIINHLEHFLLELGKWFSFVARQKRISNWTDHYFIDLVFYHRILNCFVLIDLKIGKLKHQDIGQMQMYVNRYDKEIKTEKENPTIWLILCMEKDEFVIEYMLGNKDNQQIFAREYQLYLPSKSELKNYLELLQK